MHSGDGYRTRAAKLYAKAQTAESSQLRAELESLAAQFTRFATQVDVDEQNQKKVHTRS